MKYFVKRYGKTIAAVLGGVLIIVAQSGDISWKNIGAAVLTTLAVYVAPYRKSVKSERNTGGNTHPINRS